MTTLNWEVESELGALPDVEMECGDGGAPIAVQISTGTKYTCADGNDPRKKTIFEITEEESNELLVVPATLPKGTGQSERQSPSRKKRKKNAVNEESSAQNACDRWREVKDTLPDTAGMDCFAVPAGDCPAGSMKMFEGVEWTSCVMPK